MPIILDISLKIEEANSNEALSRQIAKLIDSKNTFEFNIIKRSIDARQKETKIQLRIAVYTDGETKPEPIKARAESFVQNAPAVIIIGAGPAGLFAALELIHQGLKPIILERGKNVRERRRDLAAIHKEHIVNEDSNYCFGEGGAGTYSDGKLYTRSTKRGDVAKVLELFVQFGADPDILVNAHPHIGTNRLPKIIQAMRDYIIRCGGEVHFGERVTDLIVKRDTITSVSTLSGKTFYTNHLILATGHSARDIFGLLHSKNIDITFKPFALGVRAEHPQLLIDQVQYKCEQRHELLPPAAYSLVEQIDDRGVYSFCMCPGGIIAPCATAPGEVVTNGWSPSKRNNPWANSGIVVPVEWDDIPEFHSFGPLAGIEFQKSVEQKCFVAGGQSQAAPAQRMIDFVEKRISKDLPACSYQPGIVSCDLNTLLPDFVASRLRKAFVAFGKKLKGYYTNHAVLVATESRTSSPVKIPRDPHGLHHIQIRNLYPCGEGAGYAGGIVSAAIDGQKIASAIAAKIQQPA